MESDLTILSNNLASRLMKLLDTQCWKVVAFNKSMIPHMKTFMKKYQIFADQLALALSSKAHSEYNENLYKRKIKRKILAKTYGEYYKLSLPFINVLIDEDEGVNFEFPLADNKPIPSMLKISYNLLWNYMNIKYEFVPASQILLYLNKIYKWIEPIPEKRGRVGIIPILYERCTTNANSHPKLYCYVYAIHEHDEQYINEPKCFITIDMSAEVYDDAELLFDTLMTYMEHVADPELTSSCKTHPFTDIKNVADHLSSLATLLR